MSDQNPKAGTTVRFEIQMTILGAPATLDVADTLSMIFMKPDGTVITQTESDGVQIVSGEADKLEWTCPVDFLANADEGHWTYGAHVVRAGGTVLRTHPEGFELEASSGL